MKITEETKINDLIPKGYKSIGNAKYKVKYSNNVLRINIPIEKNRSLEDYEALVYCPWILNLKEQYPKQYYSIILQMIADDICEESRLKYHYLQVDKNVSEFQRTRYCPMGTVMFDTREHAEQAIQIMGDKLKLLI